MSDIDDLNASDATLATAVAANTAAVNGAVTELQTLAAAILANPGDAAAVEAAAQSISALAGTIGSNTSALNAAVAAAQAPAAPVVTEPVQPTT